MRDALGIFLALVFLTVGALLLYDGVSTTDLTQSARIIGGAALLSLGLAITLIVLKNWWKWKKVSRHYRDI